MQNTAFACKNDLSCCLLQNAKPVCFAYGRLISSGQIEKELLNAVWSTRKFHYYIFDQKCTILNGLWSMINPLD